MSTDHRQCCRTMGYRHRTYNYYIIHFHLPSFFILFIGQKCFFEASYLDHFARQSVLPPHSVGHCMCALHIVGCLDVLSARRTTFARQKCAKMIIFPNYSNSEAKARHLRRIDANSQQYAEAVWAKIQSNPSRYLGELTETEAVAEIVATTKADFHEYVDIVYAAHRAIRHGFEEVYFHF